MSSLNPGLNMQRAASDTLSAHWKLSMLQGVLMIVLGVFAVAVPPIATLAADLYIGWLFLISGIVGLVAMFSAGNVRAFLWSLVTAVLTVVVGALLILKPIAGALSLTLVLTAFFLVEGIFQCAMSVSYRDVMRGSWGWMLVSGMADLVLAAIIIFGWPFTAAWALGLIIGVNLITSGWAIAMAAWVGHGIVGPARASR